jgi:hypothetical protein
MVSICIGSENTGLIYCVLRENFWIRSFSASVTYTFPSESTDIASGPLNSPLPVPLTRNFVMNVPLLVNFCTFRVKASTMYTLPKAQNQYHADLGTNNILVLKK